METNIIKEQSTEFEHPVADLIKDRRSIRAFSSKTVDEETIKSLFEAARWAPSSSNEQPWMYIYATPDQSALWDKLFDALNEGNRIWVKNAPLLIASLARKTFGRNGNRNVFAKHDLGAANTLLSLQAVTLGLQSHQMGGYDAEKLRSNLNLPDDLEEGSMIAVGYPGDVSNLPDRLREREIAPRERLKQNAFVLNRSF